MTTPYSPVNHQLSDMQQRQPMGGTTNLSSNNKDPVAYEPFDKENDHESQRNSSGQNNHHYRQEEEDDEEQHQQQQYGPLVLRHHGADGRGHRSQHPWVDNMVKVATACNQLVRNRCNLCNVYADRQVEFEQRQECNECLQQQKQYEGFSSSPAMGSPTERVWQKMNSNLEVDLYRQFLFDETSVGSDLLDSAMETATAMATSVAGTPVKQPQPFAATTSSASTEMMNDNGPAVTPPVAPFFEEAAESNAAAEEESLRMLPLEAVHFETD